MRENQFILNLFYFLIYIEFFFFRWVKGQAGLPGPIGVDGIPGLSGQKGEKVSTSIGYVQLYTVFLSLHSIIINRFSFSQTNRPKLSC